MCQSTCMFFVFTLGTYLSALLVTQMALTVADSTPTTVKVVYVFLYFSEYIHWVVQFSFSSIALFSSSMQYALLSYS